MAQSSQISSIFATHNTLNHGQNILCLQPEEYIRNLTHPVAEKGFKADLDAMLWADSCVLVLPCGRSAHTEAGWFAGRGLKTIVYMPEKQEPELMYKLFDGVVGSLEELVRLI